MKKKIKIDLSNEREAYVDHNHPVKSLLVIVVVITPWIAMFILSKNETLSSEMLRVLAIILPIATITMTIGGLTYGYIMPCRTCKANQDPMKKIAHKLSQEISPELFDKLEEHWLSYALLQGKNKITITQFVTGPYSEYATSEDYWLFAIYDETTKELTLKIE